MKTEYHSVADNATLTGWFVYTLDLADAVLPFDGIRAMLTRRADKE